MMLYDALWSSMMFYDVLWCSLMFCDILWCSWCSMMFYDVFLMFFDVLWCSMSKEHFGLVSFCRSVPPEFLRLFLVLVASMLSFYLDEPLLVFGTLTGSLIVWSSGWRGRIYKGCTLKLKHSSQLVRHHKMALNFRKTTWSNFFFKSNLLSRR